MNIVRFENLNLLSIGNTIQISGMIWSGEGKSYLCFLPDEQPAHPNELVLLPMTLNEWNEVVRQSDLMETEILAKDTEGKLVKTILRKSTRQIDQAIQWKVFERDEYCCRYCGRTGIPLSVDHIILWEEGGPSTEENLITACKKCNRMRGSQQYPNWLISEYYYKVSRDIDEETRQKNAAIVQTMASIPRRIHIKSR
jgi:hypothetical protein